MTPSSSASSFSLYREFPDGPGGDFARRIFVARLGRRRLPPHVSGRRENLVEGLEEKVGVLVLEYQGWPDLENVSSRAGCAQQHATLAHRVGYLAGIPGRRCACLVDQFDAEQEALAPDVSDQGVACRECQQAVLEVGADLRSAGYQALILDDGQDRERGGAGHRVTTEGAEQ